MSFLYYFILLFGPFYFFLVESAGGNEEEGCIVGDNLDAEVSKWEGGIFCYLTNLPLG